MAVIEVSKLRKAYITPSGPLAVLRGLSFRIAAGEFVVVMGPSGAGKTTLMSILGCLDRASGGTYQLDGRDVTGIGDVALARVRNGRIGFVFQDFHLLPRLTILSNVALPLVYAGIGRVARQQRALKALERFALGSKARLLPSQVSGGQQQRAAIARALINGPSLLLADEPTGNLDTRAGTEVLAVIKELNKKQGLTVVMVTHDPAVARYADRLIRIVDGVLEHDGSLPR